MITILKEGNITDPNNSKFQSQCSECKCIFTANNLDVNKIAAPNGDLFIIKCPYCGFDISLNETVK